MYPRLRISSLGLGFGTLHLGLVLFLLAGQATSRPGFLPADGPLQIDTNEFRKHQHGFSQTEVVYIARNISIFQTVMRECCTLTFSPTTFPNDTPAVKVVENCTIENVNDSNDGSCHFGGASPDPTSITGTPEGTGASSRSSATAISTSESTASTLPPPTSTPLSLTSLPAPTTNPSSPSLSSPTESPSSVSPSLSIPSTPISSGTSIASPISSVSTTISTSSSSLATDTTSINNAATVPTKQSTTLPKVIGAFAGVSVFLLIVAGTVGYLKQKRMNKDEHEEPIRWPVT
ncbi:hypothetical protein K439DRAFT_477548 [Ramaria rubella]|nr:hypothetical protein K439DRAFT_477548 [Ramaria rubella]